MANTKISALTALTGANLAATDQLAVADGGVSKSITAAELAIGMNRHGPGVWRNVNIPLSQARRVVIGNPTHATGASISAIHEPIRGKEQDDARSPAGLIADANPDATGQPAPEYGYDGPNPTIRLGHTAFKPWLGWNINTPNSVGALWDFQLPYDMLLTPDGSGGFFSTWHLQGRMVLANAGSATLSATPLLVRTKIGCENGGDDGGLSPGAGYNFGPLQLADYTFDAAASAGDHTNLDIDGSAVRDANSRPLKPGDHAGLAMWCNRTQDSNIYFQLWWLAFRYLATPNPDAVA